MIGIFLPSCNEREMFAFTFHLLKQALETSLKNIAEKKPDILICMSPDFARTIRLCFMCLFAWHIRNQNLLSNGNHGNQLLQQNGEGSKTCQCLGEL